jgi:predicted DNA-binding ribbon-helix-helix protein
MSDAGATLRKHSVRIAGHPTSLSMEDAFWQELTAIASRRGTSVNELIATIDDGRTGSLSAAVRLFVLGDLQSRAGEG